MSGHIPFDIQSEIMKRLPVKSLMQSRSLSKEFKSLIDSSQFIADYNACESRPPYLFLRYDDPLNWVDRYYQFLSIADDNRFQQNILTTPTPHAFGFLYHLRFVGSSNGLLCFYGNDTKRYGEFPHLRDELVVIWNPCIEKYVEIDVPVMSDIYSCILGFGVCPNTNDPMLVKINDVCHPCYVEVFTLSSRVWRSLLSHEPRKSIRFEWSQVTMDGFIYWHAIDTINKGNSGDPISFCYNLIMSFDTRSEEFIELKLPNCLVPYRSDESLSLSKLMESIIVLQYYKNAEKQVCDIWKITNGVTKSFVKLFTISPPLSSLKTILGFRKTGEPIIGKLMDGSEESDNLEFYETSVEDVKEFVINGQLGSFFVSSYKETLLLHDHANRDYIPVNFNSVSN